MLLMYICHFGACFALQPQYSNESEFRQNEAVKGLGTWQGKGAACEWIVQRDDSFVMTPQ